MAGVVLTGVTGASVLGSITGVNYEAKAEESNPNSQYFNYKLGDKELDLKDIFTSNTLSAKILSEKLTSKLEAQGLNPENYKFKMTVKKTDGKTIQGGPSLVKGSEYIGTQTAEFNPNKDTITEFEIVPA